MLVDRSTEVDITDCCIDCYQPMRDCALTSVDLSTCITTFNQGISHALITRDTTDHCGNTGGEVQYGYKVSEQGLYLTLGIVI